MRKCLLALAFTLILPRPALAETSEHAYQSARKAYQSLKRDASRRKRRDAWQLVAKKFEAVAVRYPQSAESPNALFTAGQLLGELSRISYVAEDLDSSLSDYRKLMDAHPHHPLAQEASLALAHAQLDRLNQPESARKTLLRALQVNPHAARRLQMRSLLASIPAPAPEPVAHRELSAHRGGAAPSARREEEENASDAPSPTAVRPRERLRELARLRDGNFSLSEQLGLKVRRVVIDPGHGGHDSGTMGPGGTREKEVSLGIARKLQRALEAQGLSVVMTREDDHYVRLEDRARIANAARGDLFISIHCNSAPQHSLRGIETYTLNTASDRYSLRLAARENASTERGVSDLQFILADLATKSNTEESTRLAARVQKGLVGKLASHYSSIRDLGNKQALFYVLLGAKMPAILVETSFLSNADDEKRLRDRAYQEDVAQAIASGVQDFLGYRERLAKVD